MSAYGSPDPEGAGREPSQPHGWGPQPPSDPSGYLPSTDHPGPVPPHTDQVGYQAADPRLADPYAPPGPGPGAPGYAGQVTPSSSNRVLGWAGIGILYVLALWQLVIPSIRTLIRSTQDVSPLADDAEFVGLTNWGVMMPELLPALARGVVMVLPVTLVAIVLGLVIGAAMAPQQRVATPVRIGVGILGALFVPIGVGLGQWEAAGAELGDPGGALTFVVVVSMLSGLPLLTALFATAFAVAFGSRSPGRGVVAVVVLGLTGMVAIGPQMFDLAFVFTGGGPGEATTTPAIMAYRLGFLNLTYGFGSVAESVLLLLAGVLGIAAVLVLVLLKVRVGVDAPAGASPPGRAPSGAVGIVGIVLVAIGVVVALVIIGPVLLGAFADAPDGAPSGLQTAWWTWGPPAFGTVIQLVVAVIGGAAIGWYRPAGRHSLWLLLPLAPWLFVGPLPLILDRYLVLHEGSRVNSWLGLLPPGVVVGAVVALALVFFGLRDQRDAGPVPVAKPVLGVVTAAAGVLLLTQAQSLVPAMIVVFDPSRQNAPSVVMQIMTQSMVAFDELGGVAGLLYPLPMLLVVAALGVGGQLLIRRLRLMD